MVLFCNLRQYLGITFVSCHLFVTGGKDGHKVKVGRIFECYACKNRPKNYYGYCPDVVKPVGANHIELRMIYRKSS